jgi:hypothetical protein
MVVDREVPRAGVIRLRHPVFKASSCAKMDTVH